MKRSKEGRLGLYDVELTSQSWHGIAWIHRIKIIIPKGTVRPYVMLMVTWSGDGHEELALCSEISRLNSAFEPGHGKDDFPCMCVIPPGFHITIIAMIINHRCLTLQWKHADDVEVVWTGSDLFLKEVPQLKDGSLVIGLSGWGDAGNVSTLCVTYLIEKLDATEIGEISSGRFYDYHTKRPLVSIERGVIKNYVPPRNQFYCWKAKAGYPAILLLRGVEPHVDWPAYARNVIEAVEKMDISRIYMIGAYVGNVPHTVEPSISVSSRSEPFLKEMSSLGLEFADYEGPTGIYSEIIEQGHKQGIDAVSIWGAVPPYIQGTNYKVAFYILDKIVSMVGVEISLLEMKEKGDDLDEQIALEAKQNPDLRRLISSMELEYRSVRRFDSYIV